MTAEPWFDLPTAIGIGVAGGVWGSLVGVGGGLLVPKGRGKPFVFGLLLLGVLAGATGVVGGLVGLLVGQPYAVWYPLLLSGVLFTALSWPFLYTVRRAYRQVELRKMHAEEMPS